MCLRNYASGVRQLKAVSEDEETVKYYEKQLKKLKKKRFFNGGWFKFNKRKES